MADNQGSFVTGLTVGLFAGAASYFLLLTPNGRKMRLKLEKEWQAAQAAGATAGPSYSEHPNVTTIRSLFGTLRQVIVEAADQAQPSPITKKAKRLPSKKNDPRFKGV